MPAFLSFLVALIAKQTSCGTEYPFSQFGSAVLAMSFLRSCSALDYWVRRGECWSDSLDAVRALLSSS